MLDNENPMNFMDNSNQNKIVILEETQAHRNFLKTIVRDTGHLVFVFDKETTFFNNILPIDADLIVFRAASMDKVSRILNTMLYLDYHKPVIVISDKPEIRHFIASIPDNLASVLDPRYQPLEIKTTINTLLNESNGNGYRNSLPVIVGNTPEIVRIREMVPELKNNNDSIFIQGERGTGKALLAKSIHIASTKNDHSFIKTNISEQLFKSVQTDMEKYHGKMNQIISPNGKAIFENKDGGTIYFEAIDTIPVSFQGVLLQCFESHQAKRVRVIASSHSEIDHLVQEGAFRKDLYFRLNVIKINVPPLRERKTDIPLLADFFINKRCIESGICHFQLSAKVKKALSEYHWPNNVEELEAFITIDNFMGNEDRILDRVNALIEKNRSQKPDRLNTDTISGDMNGAENRVSLKKISKHFTSRIETELLKLVLEKTNWNRKQAAKTLAISYKSLLNKIKAYNLN